MNSTFASFLLSVVISLLSVLFFTQNVFIAVWSILTVLLMVMTLFGFITSYLEWEFGAIQAVGLTTFVGLSVDYVLHLSHTYHHSEEGSRTAKVVDALLLMGSSI